VLFIRRASRSRRSSAEVLAYSAGKIGIAANRAAAGQRGAVVISPRSTDASLYCPYRREIDRWWRGSRSSALDLGR